MTVNNILQSLPSNYLKDLNLHYNFWFYSIQFRPFQYETPCILCTLNEIHTSILAVMSTPRSPGFIFAIFFFFAFIMLGSVAQRGSFNLKSADKTVGNLTLTKKEKVHFVFLFALTLTYSFLGSILQKRIQKIEIANRNSVEHLMKKWT